MGLRVWMIAVVSTLLFAVTAQSHEIDPTVTDVILDDGRVTLQVTLNLEAFVAGIDLETIENTDASENSADYDALRVLPPEDIRAEFMAYWSQMQSRLIVMSEGQMLQFELQSVEIPPVGNAELPRQSIVTMAADHPTNAPVQVGWDRSLGSMILRQIGPDEDAFTGYLAPGQLSPPLSRNQAAAENGWQTFMRYIPVGFDHIVPKGLDHILFVLGLFFLTARLGGLLWQVSAFTLAHTVTLALGVTGLVNVPAEIVEPLIAASIVYVAVENLFTDGLKPWRPVVIFGFGLLHGLGFASVLGQFGLPDGQLIAALIGFNVGVELGQLAVIAVAFLAVGLWFRNKPWYKPYIAKPASCLIAAVGAFWFIERVFLA
ncbi:HupE/UreJ family protein [Sulfitobacter sp. 1151]|uniref:HupE/UreJ family protein n=2 Tax=Parasulfitobacter algicola TaxID=2614809 RepID=A0ABX2IQH9_9RHOB|nr:HupE/UreJ family protein [Sulfitobacter algicola]